MLTKNFQGQERHFSFNSMIWILPLVKRWYWSYFLSCIKIMGLCPILNEYLAYDFKRLPIHDISHDYGKLGWCRRCAPARILKKTYWLVSSFYSRQRELHCSLRLDIDIFALEFGTKTYWENVYLLLTFIAYRRMTTLKWTIHKKRKRKKRGKKIHKTVDKKTISMLRKKSSCRRLLSNRKHYRMHNITNN